MLQPMGFRSGSLHVLSFVVHRAMVLTWGDLSPSSREDSWSRLHPAFLLGASPRHSRSDARMTCQEAPRLGPVEALAQTFPVEALPPSISMGELGTGHIWLWPVSAPYLFEPCALPRLWWTTYCAWESRCGATSGIPWPVLGLISVYVHTYLFADVRFPFLWDLRSLIAIWLPGNAVAPVWLWELLFRDGFL